MLDLTMNRKAFCYLCTCLMAKSILQGNEFHMEVKRLTIKNWM